MTLYQRICDNRSNVSKTLFHCAVPIRNLEPSMAARREANFDQAQIRIVFHRNLYCDYCEQPFGKKAPENFFEVLFSTSSLLSRLAQYCSASLASRVLQDCDGALCAILPCVAITALVHSTDFSLRHRSCQEGQPRTSS